jgi:hypothetical protein
MKDTSLFLLFLQEINSERRLISRRNPGIPASQLTKKQREITSAWCLLSLLIKIVDIAHSCRTWLAMRVLADCSMTISYQRAILKQKCRHGMSKGTPQQHAKLVFR